MTTIPDNPGSPAQAPMSEDARGRMAERIAEIEARIQHGMAGDALVLMREHVPWLLEQLHTAQAEVERLRGILTLAPDIALVTTQEFAKPIAIVDRTVWDAMEVKLACLRAVVDAARALAAEGRYIAGMAGDDPFKGNGNRLVDAIAVLDAAEGKTT